MARKLTSFILLGFMVLATLSCSKNEDDPYAELPAPLQAMVAESGCACEPYINLYKWRDQQVFVLLFRGPACNWRPTYYDSRGNSIEMEEGYTLDDFINEAEKIKTVWTCE
ncbi:hypothetical protein [Olivibacter sitiensis]|uniref:hypothetical protein n=1 Tax=Olivibacter sitiensis TaxID=376470 RepID=UPI0004269893|nr:hypothetical protein [Olivibacter sitiensis]